MNLSSIDLAKMLTDKRSCQEGVGLYRVDFAWVDWYAKRQILTYDTNDDAHLEEVGPVGWDMSTAVHADSPTIVMGEPFNGPLCAHEVQVLKTGHDSTGAAVTNPRWEFTVSSAMDVPA